MRFSSANSGLDNNSIFIGIKPFGSNFFETRAETMKIFFLASFLTAAACLTAFGQNNSQKGFAIYPPADNIKSNRLSQIDLKKLKSTGTPLIAGSDIQYYQSEDFKTGRHR
jgi:hypothetical protein